jgi:hypothetical protein
VELTIIRVAWTFNFDFSHYMLAGVIWMMLFGAERAG